MLILCKCGCGQERENVDSQGRKRLYIRNHQRIGKHHSEKSKQKNREKHVGGNGTLGKHWKLSEESKKNISDGHKGNKSYLYGKVGNEHPAWKGDSKISPLYEQIRHSDKYSNWRTQIFGRDNFTCQECSKRGSWLEAHHKKEFYKIIKENNIFTFEAAMNCDELWDVFNGQTLCKKCHDKTKKGKGK